MITCDKTLDIITIFCFDHDFEAAVERLRPMACWEEVKLVVRADIDTPDFLNLVSASMPQITSLTFRKRALFWVWLVLISLPSLQLHS
jgi:hypothetical protein